MVREDDGDDDDDDDDDDDGDDDGDYDDGDYDDDELVVVVVMMMVMMMMMMMMLTGDAERARACGHRLHHQLELHHRPQEVATGQLTMTMTCKSVFSSADHAG
jgi:glycerol dehydrogenase-like iron-containing ADH family enzyme